MRVCVGASASWGSCAKQSAEGPAEDGMQREADGTDRKATCGWEQFAYRWRGTDGEKRTEFLFGDGLIPKEDN